LIRRWLRRTVAGADEDDLVQEVLGAVLRAMPTFVHSGRTGSFRRWLRTTTANTLAGFWRRRRTTSGELPPVEWELLEDSESELSRSWDREHDTFIARRLLELMEPEFSPTTWLAFRRQVIDGAAAAVAGEMGMTVNAVLLAKSRVLARLRKEGRGLID
jgi:RNA polymerase sigma-70 factor (ECF subfamily)